MNGLLFPIFVAAALCFCSCSSGINGYQKIQRRQILVKTEAGTIINAEDILNAAQTIGVVIVEVPFDPVYGAKRSYRALPLMKVLEKFAAKELPLRTQAEIVFSCEDGYQSILHGNDTPLGSAFLAISDIHAAPHQEWLPIENRPGNFSPGPLYLVWTNKPTSNLPWPYQISRVEIRPAGTSLVRTQPSKAALAEKGFALFLRNCINCHSINGSGGTFGVDLNIPQNVTEYWNVSALKKLIINPASIRANTKMPAFPQLTKSDVNALVAYLRDMRTRKYPPLSVFEATH